MSDSIFLIVREIIARYLAIDPKRVVPSANFIEDLGADSLDVVELVMLIEDRFEIEIEDFCCCRNYDSSRRFRLPGF